MENDKDRFDTIKDKNSSRDVNLKKAKLSSEIFKSELKFNYRTESSSLEKFHRYKASRQRDTIETFEQDKFCASIDTSGKGREWYAKEREKEGWKEEEDEEKEKEDSIAFAYRTCAKGYIDFGNTRESWRISAPFPHPFILSFLLPSPS
ncbi:hypothetical protein HZH68_001412 [Vespula germanica]|uniref:Uncharacterized protein n=1 Tax=Vespula germanica TaxID=30212 RepID=A0A834U6N8_VESGE|nr:hypothetical protein HZH68_001412 [Vespula germanica]